MTNLLLGLMFGLGKMEPAERKYPEMWLFCFSFSLLEIEEVWEKNHYSLKINFCCVEERYREGTVSLTITDGCRRSTRSQLSVGVQLSATAFPDTLVAGS